MSDEKIVPVGEEAKQEPKQPELFLNIKLTEVGGLQVTGILNNEPLALWMLDKAKDVIKFHNAQEARKQEPKILKPNGLLNFARGKR